MPNPKIPYFYGIGEYEKKEKIMEGNSLKLLSKYRTQIMGFAALWILIFHSWKVVAEEYSMLWRVEFFIKKTGFAGVDILLFVSGLGLVYAIEKYKLKEFYIRRFVNVYPAFLLVGIALSLIRNWDMEMFWTSVLCIRFYTVNIIQMMWYVPAVLTLYLFFPLYYKFFKKSSNKTEFTICAWMIWLLLSIVLIGHMREDVYGFTNRIPVFLAGILAGYYIKEKDIVITKQRWIFVIIGFLLGVYLSYYTNIKNQGFMVPISNCCAPNFLMAIFGSILLAKLFWFLDTYCKKIGKMILEIFRIPGIASLELYAAQDVCGMGIGIRNNLPTNNLLVQNVIIITIIFGLTAIIYVVCKLVKSGINKLLGY